MAQLTVNLRNPFEEGPPIFSWGQSEEPPSRFQKVVGAVQDKLFSYALEKVLSKSGLYKAAEKILIEQLEAKGIPAGAIKEVADVVFAGIKAGMRG